jgi:hypothetical protein
MTAIPFAVPLAWSRAEGLGLQRARFAAETGRDCRRFRRYFR